MKPCNQCKNNPALLGIKKKETILHEKHNNMDVFYRIHFESLKLDQMHIWCWCLIINILYFFQDGNGEIDKDELRDLFIDIFPAFNRYTYRLKELRINLSIFFFTPNIVPVI